MMVRGCGGALLKRERGSARKAAVVNTHVHDAATDGHHVEGPSLEGGAAHGNRSAYFTL
jgi:hypothetical protein